MVLMWCVYKLSSKDPQYDTDFTTCPDWHIQHPMLKMRKKSVDFISMNTFDESLIHIVCHQVMDIKNFSDSFILYCC